MRIVYCIDEIEASGGTERIIVTKANSLSNIPGNDVVIVVAYYRGNKRYELDPKVRLIDLDVRYYDDIGLNKFKEICFVIRKRREHSRKLRNVLEELAPDVVISSGMSEKFIIPKLSISSNPALIREMHFSKYYRRASAYSLYEKLIAFVGEYIDYRMTIRGFDKIVVLTREDKVVNWKAQDNVVVIPNPLPDLSNNKSSLNNSVAVTAGRLVRTKNFQSMIRAWQQIHTYYPEWKLKIYGEGPLHSDLSALIDSLSLNGVVTLEGYVRDLYNQFSESSMFLLTSKTEGFGMVLLEAMSCGLPLVSYDCPSGPKDIIEEGVNGYLVPLNNESILVDRIKRLIDNHELRIEMGKSSFLKSKEYSINSIISKWMSLFQSVIDEKRSSN